MANLLATAATHGGVISRAISNGKRFTGAPAAGRPGRAGPRERFASPPITNGANFAAAFVCSYLTPPTVSAGLTVVTLAWVCAAPPRSSFVSSTALDALSVLRNAPSSIACELLLLAYNLFAELGKTTDTAAPAGGQAHWPQRGLAGAFRALCPRKASGGRQGGG